MSTLKRTIITTSFRTYRAKRVTADGIRAFHRDHTNIMSKRAYVRLPPADLGVEARS
jgi:hypothetical protein